ncbi:GAF domain-containing protein [Microbacterium sp. MC2]
MAEPTATPAAFRAPMRSRDDAVPAGGAVERALTDGLCGLGGRLDTPPANLDAAVRAVDANYGERAARRLERFAAAPDGAFVWTRDVDGVFWLGRLAGTWRYDADPAAVAVDLVHVRPCRWLPTPVDDAEVPSEVQASFARGGRNWQTIRAPGAAAATAAVWAARSDW